MTHKAIMIWNLPSPWASCLAVFLTGPLSALLSLSAFLNVPYPSPVPLYTIIYAGQAAHRVLMHPVLSPPPTHLSSSMLLRYLPLWAAVPESPQQKLGSLTAPLALTTVLQLLMSVSVLSRADPCFIHLCVRWSITNNGRCFLKDCWVNECLD